MNERDIARGFSAVWSEFFPMLSPTFIIAFNDAFVRPILGRGGIVGPVAPREGVRRPDVLAEFGFRLAAAAYESRISVRAAANNEAVLDAANLAAVNRTREFGAPLLEEEFRLSDFERREGVRLASVYEEFLALWPATDAAIFLPAIHGSGVLSSCFADLAVGRTLFEVKTVVRPFHSCDLRQLLVYLALQAMTDEKRWEYGGLLNPKLGVFCSFSVDWLVMRLSGGRPPKLVFSDFVQALSRDFVLDHRF